MEIYVPYVIGSSLTAFLGKIAYSYYNLDETNPVLIDEIISDDYDLMADKIPNNTRILDGLTFKDKSNSIKLICKNSCGFEIFDNKKKKTREKILRYINEYQTIGHDKFVESHKKYKFN
jgi:hypothetical protein